MMHNKFTNKAILRIGEVSQVEGRTISISVDKEKNASDLIINGDIIKNISVNSYLEIRKGFTSLIGKVDGEKIVEDTSFSTSNGYEQRNRSKRLITVSLSGYINKNGDFIGGMQELPLIGNEAYLLTNDKLHQVHNLVNNDDLSINIAKTDIENQPIALPIDGLFNGHIAIFGNTGSGKSNTLASLYQNLVSELRKRNTASFDTNSKYVLFDFNGEYGHGNCITRFKKVYNLSTKDNSGDKIPLSEPSLMDLEILSILADATEKTQRPFIRRTLRLYNDVFSKDDPIYYFKNILKKRITHTLGLSDKAKAFQLIDYFREVLPTHDTQDNDDAIDEDLEWNNTHQYFYGTSERNRLDSKPERIPHTKIYQRADIYNFPADLMLKFIHFLYIQLIFDLLTNRAQNEHIAPAINKLKSKNRDLSKIFDTTGSLSFWQKNFVIVNLNNINLDMKKTIPLLLAKKLYLEHKQESNKALTFIIDEAHNILSKESFREAESWKDYRLETFEEIIKEGRKFGVFVTISSQRPSDISPTITSQAHNYFLHRLINQKDLNMISSVVSYIDKVTEESIPVLPTGTCVFSGVSSSMPLKLIVDELKDDIQPKSKTLKYADIVSANKPAI